MTSAALASALAVLLPTDCVGCGVRDRALCDGCRRALEPPGPPLRLSIERGADAPLAVWASRPYGGVIASALSALKECGRTDVAPALGRTLAAALSAARSAASAALPAEASLEIVPAPSSASAFRARGYHPVRLLLRSAQCEHRPRDRLRVESALRVGRATVDQAGLDVRARRANLSGSLRVRRKFSGALDGRFFLLVDDVVTTGSTLIECRRALEHAGATVVGAVTLAFTPRHTGTSAVRLSAEREGQMG
ncbi:phosphoribosyltransferase [Subtercola sp. Z020]|uniref:ComF family protein n=1 Tax=Subtercola sp. Z020 TaxID=2080582 RepID=UPI000CE82C2D|nr:phosphoribosyltransferase family protein [Subtercola sp. Z020]PPF82417.1 phosphoribosyltransferase [Subtercola sp. Z020]